MVCDRGDTFMPGTAGATIENAVGLDTVPHDPAPTVVAGRRQHVDGALETVECMGAAGSGHLKREVIVVAANVTLGHNPSELKRRSLRRVRKVAG